MKKLNGFSRFFTRLTKIPSCPIRLVLLSLIALPLIALLISLSVDTYRRYLTDSANAYQLSNTVLARTVAQTDLFLDNGKFVLEQLSKRPNVRSLDPDHCDPLLAEVSALQLAYSTLITLDAQGHLVCSAHPVGLDQPTKPDLADFFDTVSQTQQFTVGRPHIGFVTDRWISVLAYPIFDDAGRFNGAIAAGADLVHYEDIIADTTFFEDMSIGLLTTEGVNIARSGSSDNQVGMVIDSPAFRLMQRQRQGVALAENQYGQRRLYTFTPIRNTDWIAFASVDEAAIIGPILKSAITRLLWLLGLMIPLAGIIIWLARRIASSIEHISTTMEHIAQGSLSQRATPQGPTELRNIATKLNAMLDARDRMDLRQQEDTARIKYLAFTDTLTGLPNKAAALELFNATLAAAQEHNSNVAALYIDVNKLNQTNETYGHSIGDSLIMEVGIRLKAAMQPGMTAARLMGDKFMVVIAHLPTPEAVAAYADAVLSKIAKPYRIQGLHLSVTFSIGIVMYPEDGTDSDILLRRADTALSAAKLAGPNRTRAYETGMNSDVIRFTDTRNALQLALERQEFEMYYQPQIDLQSGKVVGAEALLRWNRPDHGIVAPGRFIDVAEDSGLIIEIGKWVLNDVCLQARTWRNHGLDGLTFSVNISAVQFRQGLVAAHVHDALANSGLQPENLELELTESIFLQTDVPVLSILADWKARGIKLTIDDFGTGYSSLQYLKRLRIDKLKLDQSFIKNLTDQSEDYAIVQAIIHMAQALKLKTVAEGVEDEPTLDQLKLLGCDQAQGYWFARPMPASQFFQWVNSQARR